MNFGDRLTRAALEIGNPCVVGLDPHLDLLPAEFDRARDASVPREDRAAAMAEFLCELIDVAAGRVPAVKPQSAFFEVFGAAGVAAWERVVTAARQAGLLVIGDVKRGDIGSTAASYARAYLEGLTPADEPHLCDAITVNAYLGGDSLEPFLAACERTGRGLFVLVRTSNPGSSDFQQHGSPELSAHVARCVAQWGDALVGPEGLSSIGAVVGATHPEVLQEMRALMPRTPLLLPGYGAQGAGAHDVVDAFLAPDPPGELPCRGALVSASRSVAFAHRSPEHAGKHWKDAARDALDGMVREVRAALSASLSGSGA